MRHHSTLPGPKKQKVGFPKNSGPMALCPQTVPYSLFPLTSLIVHICNAIKQFTCKLCTSVLDYSTTKQTEDEKNKAKSNHFARDFGASQDVVRVSGFRQWLHGKEGKFRSIFLSLRSSLIVCVACEAMAPCLANGNEQNGLLQNSGRE